MLIVLKIIAIYTNSEVIIYELKKA